MIWHAPLWMIAVCALLLWLPQNVQHEGAHALVARIYGHRITMFRPWPTRLGDGWAFAAMAHSGPRLTDRAYGLIYAAPIIASTLVLVATYIALHLVEPGGWLAAALAGWALTSLVDGSVWFLTYARLSPSMAKDGWKVLWYWQLSPWMGRVVGLCWLALWWAAMWVRT